MEAKVRSFYVRPIHSVDLSFNTAGILSTRSPLARLGAPISSFDPTDVRTALETKDENGRHTYDSARIAAAFNSTFLFTLRNDVLGASLRQSIAQRQMAFLEKYKHKAQIIAALQKLYPANLQDPTGKVNRLQALSKLSADRKDAIQTQYQADPNIAWAGVLKESAVSTWANQGAGVATTMLTPVAMKTDAYTITVNGGGQSSTHSTPDVISEPEAAQSGAWNPLRGGDLSFRAQQTTTDMTAVKQTTTSRGTEFRHPTFENSMRDQRAQVDLQDELLLHTTYSYRVPDMDKIIDCELEVIDQEVLKNQLRFMQTFLYSPVSGVVTTIYKDLGEAVQPGEPVLRVENDDRVLLVGLVQYRAALQLHQRIELTTNGVFESGDRLRITGEVVSVRGHDADSDVWDVIVEADNSHELVLNGRTSQVKLPINYQFDRKSTVAEVVPREPTLASK